MQIGKIHISGKTALAPMRAVNCPSFRLLCKENGASLVCTQSFWSWEIDKWKDRLDVEFSPGNRERPLSVQVGGSTHDEIKAALELLEPHADIIDFNSGCGENWICGKQSGAFMMLHPKQLKSVVSVVLNFTNKPVTVKMRTGWDDKQVNCVEIAKMLEDLGVAAIAIHGRTRTQAYTGKANWNQIKEVKSAVNIPVFGNGDITSPEEAKKMLESTGCDAVMLGRGAKGNPLLFKQINEFLDSGTFTEISLDDRFKSFLKFANYYHTFERDRSVSEFKHHALWFLKGMESASKIKEKLKDASIADIEQVFENELAN